MEGTPTGRKLINSLALILGVSCKCTPLRARTELFSRGRVGYGWLIYEGGGSLYIDDND